MNTIPPSPVYSVKSLSCTQSQGWHTGQFSSQLSGRRSDSTLWRSEMLFYRTLWRLPALNLTMLLNLLSQNISLPDVCWPLGWSGMRWKEGKGEALGPALTLQVVTVRINNRTQKQRVLINTHWYSSDKGFRLKPGEKGLQNQFVEIGYISMKRTNSSYWR